MSPGRSGGTVAISSIGGDGADAGLAAARACRMAEAEGAAVVIEIGRGRRGHTLLSTAAARAVEREVEACGSPVGIACRGCLCFVALAGPDAEGGGAGRKESRDEAADPLIGDVLEVVGAIPERVGVVIAAGPGACRRLIDDGRLGLDRVLLRTGPGASDPLARLAIRDAERDGIPVEPVTGGLSWTARRRALAGMGERRAERARRPAIFGRRLAGRSGQAMPMVLGAIFLLMVAAVGVAAVAGAVTGKGRQLRAADLAALSAARSMRDDLPRVLSPPELPNGMPNPMHMSKAAYLARARSTAARYAVANGAGAGAVKVSFPDAVSFAPLEVRVAIAGAARAGASVATRTSATAEVGLPAIGAGGGGSRQASGGGYSGTLAIRQGKGMRPDVARAFDRMSAAASAAGISLIVNSAFRSDAEQAALFAANPDPKWVAPPGTSLHRCATELDLGPPSAVGWLAANAPRFGFAQRYSWEDWHFGYVAGPAPCSDAGDRVGAAGGAGPDGSRPAEASLPSFVPAEFRRPLIEAAAHWNVSAALLAAQLMAESNFNPYATSSAGAEGIAQFMPATAASYGLEDPFDPAAAIDAQAHLMSDLLHRFGSVRLALAAYNAGPGAVEPCGCVPDYPETVAYVARILGLMGGAGSIAPVPMEVHLID